jgi:NAD dependent epimerase/dehydratase family enzyme
VGSGRQIMSWVDLDDAVAAIHHALFDDELSGPFNVTAPSPVSNAELARTLARVLGRRRSCPCPPSR